MQHTCSASSRFSRSTFSFSIARSSSPCQHTPNTEACPRNVNVACYCACESSVPRRVYPTRRVPVLDMLARGAAVHGYSRARACVFAGALGAVQAMPWPTSSFSFRSSPSFSDVTASSLCPVRTRSLSQPTLTALTRVTPSAGTPCGPPEYSRRQYCTPRCACPAQGLGWVTQAWVYLCARANYPSACMRMRHLSAILATPRNMPAPPLARNTTQHACNTLNHVHHLAATRARVCACMRV